MSTPNISQSTSIKLDTWYLLNYSPYFSKFLKDLNFTFKKIWVVQFGNRGRWALETSLKYFFNKPVIIKL